MAANYGKAAKAKATKLPPSLSEPETAFGAVGAVLIVTMVSRSVRAHHLPFGFSHENRRAQRCRSVR